MIDRIKGRLKREFGQFKNQFSNTCYLSIGENCLTDDILRRFNIKSFSTPYSHGRSNLDYAIQLEKEEYSNLLNNKFLYMDETDNITVVRNKHYTNSDKIYCSAHVNDFEFTHHNVLFNKQHRDSYRRKIQRMQELNSRKKLKFLYHYRENENKDIDLIIQKAKEFLSFYQKRNIDSELIFFTQEIVTNNGERALEKIYDDDDVKGYVLKTLEIWAGSDQDLFWAKNDDDLLHQMIEDIK